MLDLAWRCNNWGVQAVMVRPWLSAKEIKHMTAATNVYNAYMSREKYRDKDGFENWAEWAGKFKRDAAILNVATEAAHGSE